MRVDFASDVGTVRSSNQDSCDCGLFSESSAWAIVCDGMGGANGGNVASTVAMEQIRSFIISNFSEDLSLANLKNMMLNAISKANTAVHDMSLERENLSGMGTTVVLMIASKGALHVAHAGDSRAYMKNSQGIFQITMDHSYVQDLVNFGQITKEEARVHPQRNIITRVLGVHSEIRCDYDCLDFAPGDCAIACTDGLSNYAEDNLLEEYIEKYGQNGEELAQRLVRFAVDSGGSDNITVAVINNC